MMRNIINQECIKAIECKRKQWQLDLARYEAAAIVAERIGDRETAEEARRYSGVPRMMLDLIEGKQNGL